MDNEFLYKLNLPTLLTGLKSSLIMHKSLYGHPRYLGGISPQKRLESATKELDSSDDNDVLWGICDLVYIIIDYADKRLSKASAESSRILALCEPDMLIEAIAYRLGLEDIKPFTDGEIAPNFTILFKAPLDAINENCKDKQVVLLESLKQLVELFLSYKKSNC